MNKDDLLKTFGLVFHETTKTQRYIGKTFGRLTVNAVGKKSLRYWFVCSCSCGTDIAARLDKVVSGHTRSCGCLHPEAVIVHGQHSNPVYQCWRRMMSRCYQPTDKRFSRYGGRGIAVCKRWHDRDTFIADMGPSFRPGLQIERINNDEGYSPRNCRWASHSEQQRNRGNNLRYTINGVTKVLAEWCREYGATYRLAHERITKQGWPPLDALTRPVRGK